MYGILYVALSNRFDGVDWSHNSAFLSSLYTISVYLFPVDHITSLPYESIRSVQALPNGTFIVLVYKGLYFSETYTGWFIRKIFDWLEKVRPTSPNMFFRGEMIQFDMKGKVVHEMFDSVLCATPSLIINGQDVLAVLL